jgi:short-subunit dehydrogenase
VDAGVAGTIVNVSSALGYAPSRMLPAYATTKAAVLMLNNCIRAELADDSIHVVSVCPGVIDTGITRATFFVGVDGAEQERLRDSAKRFYHRRNLPPAAVAEAIMDAILHHREEVPVGIEAKLGRWLSYVPGMARKMARLEMNL